MNAILEMESAMILVVKTAFEAMSSVFLLSRFLNEQIVISYFVLVNITNNKRLMRRSHEAKPLEKSLFSRLFELGFQMDGIRRA